MQAVSSRGSEPPALVSSVSGEVVGGCCEAAVAPISATKLAQQEWIMGQTATKLAQQAKKGRFWGVLCALGELFRAWTPTKRSRANLVAVVGPRRGWGGLAAVPVGGGGAWPGFEARRRAKRGRLASRAAGASGARNTSGATQEAKPQQHNEKCPRKDQYSQLHSNTPKSHMRNMRAS